MKSLIIGCLLLLFGGVASATDVVVRNDLSYLPDDHAKHKLDLYIPGTEGKYPVVVFIHGGGWKDGDKNLYSFIGNYFAKNNTVCAIVNYRLSPEVKHPDHCCDVTQAVSWVYRNIHNYRGDRSHMTLMGHSAGSHIASLIVLDDKYLRNVGLTPKHIQGVVALSGIYQITALVRTYGQGAFDRTDDANPIDYVRSGAPRFLLIYGDKDMLSIGRQNEKFYARLQQYEVPSQIIVGRDKDHVAIITSLPVDAPYADDVLRFIRQVPTARTE